MTLWTPDGERQVKPKDEPQSAAPSTNSTPTEVPAGPDGVPLTPEQQEQAEQMAQEMSEARERLLETEVSTVLANHALGIYELGAIHLTADEPKLDEAKLAIDALASIVENLEGRLGEPEATLIEALQQLKLGFVQRSADIEKAESETEPSAS